MSKNILLPKRSSSIKEIQKFEEKNNSQDDEFEDIMISEEEKKDFTIKLTIQTKVMDNREEIKHCICHNYISLNEDLETENQKQNDENVFIEEEIIPNISIPIIRVKNNNTTELNNIESPDKFCIKMNELTKELKKIGYPLSGSMINIYINYTDEYVYFGTEPLDDKTLLYSYMLEPNKDIIKIKIINYIQKRMLDGYTNAIINTYFRKPIEKKNKKKDEENDGNMPSLELKIYQPSMTNFEYFTKDKKKEEDDKDSLTNQEDSDNDEENEYYKEKYKDLTDSKKRERKIGYIIEKVYAWRKLYNGYRDDKDKFIKYPLEEAAKEINVSKKSLDDYLLQIRLGRKYGFNFDENKNEKIGKLRSFVFEENKKLKNNGNKERKPRKKKTKKKKEENNNININEDNKDSNNMFLNLKKGRSNNFKKK